MLFVHVYRKLPNLNQIKTYTLLTDSLSSLQSLSNPFSSNPIIQRIYPSLCTIDSINSKISFIWIPSHINFPPHDEVDKAAKQATSFPKITDPIPSPATDLKIFYQSLVTHLWYKNWEQQTNNKLRKIKNKPILWCSSFRESRREEVILACLRIGHTPLTHSYLLLNLAPPSCPHCDEDNLSVEHFFICPALQTIRIRLKIPLEIKSALRNNSSNLTSIFSCLRETKYYAYI